MRQQTSMCGESNAQRGAQHTHLRIAAAAARTR